MPYKLLAGVLMVSSLLTLLLSVGQLYWDYRVDISALDAEIVQIKTVSLDLLATGLWEVDRDQVRFGLQGIKRNQDIEYVELMSPSLEMPALGNEPPPSFRTSEWVFDLTHYQPAIQQSFSLGKLRVVASLDRIYRRILDKALIVFFSHFIKAIIVSIFILGVVRQIVTRHLLSIRDFIQMHKGTFADDTLTLSRTNEPFGNVKDEIDVVVDTINNFISLDHEQSKAIQQQIERARDAEEKLKSNNEQLAVQLDQHLATILKQRQSLEESARLSALGKMAGGIAHEINNPLAIIEGNCHRLTEAKTLDVEGSKKRTATILDMVARISAIVNSLRIYSRQDEDLQDKRMLYPIKAIVDETLAFCRERMGRHDIRLEIKPISPEIIARCNNVAISQVLVNLLNNAIDAVKESDERWITIAVHDSRAAVELAVTDSGPGVPANIRDKIMDPFFTTKPLGKGTGLGLSISRAIALSHNGTFSYDASSPKTRFVLRIPKNS